MISFPLILLVIVLLLVIYDELRSVHAYDFKTGKKGKFERGNRVDGKLSHVLTFPIQPLHVDSLLRTLHEVSSPAHPRYGHHLSIEQARNITRNSAGAQEVQAYLQRQGARIVEVSPFEEYVVAEAEVGVWERMLGTEFHHYRHETWEVDVDVDVDVLVRAEKMSMPESLKGHVTDIWNAADFPSTQWLSRRQHQEEQEDRRDQRNALEVLADTSSAMTIAQLRRMYGIPANLTTGASIAQALVTFEDAHASAAVSTQRIRNDVSQFASANNVQLGSLSILEYVDASAECTTCRASADTMLSLEYMMGVAGKEASTVLYYANATSSSYVNPWVRMLQDMAKMNPMPLVINIMGFEYEIEVPQSVIDAFNVEAMKLGAAGVTLVTSAGKEGAALCAEDGEMMKGAIFPATSPYVTVVGASMVSS